MPATVQIREKNGTTGAPSSTDKTSGNIIFCSADNATPGVAYPIAIPATGQNYSFEKWTVLHVTAPPDTNISNLRFYTDGSDPWSGSGLTLLAKTESTYATPVEAPGAAGYGYAFSYTSSSSLSLGAGPFTGTGEKGDHAVFAMQILSSANPGQLSGEQMAYCWDEI